ncbi:extracellular solute-binding protein [Paenibacillus sp. CGMCC 1.16610]|uniref:Extracellular solute-binding protein n=1 Tax=Paenibacillus anseongense TaxID=2682845 RepID=A0ABW9U817_9BACL|nr:MULTISPECIES: extracellular solute-binding protein [Paenibacillus]MBA2939001.1 extracellular solute-binding protein [Paenibacillus sp. CGMCC 1.16610]MVQ34963.1 extracellular solute-binding protein [Paenibacillus anseongense]
MKKQLKLTALLALSLSGLTVLAACASNSSDGKKAGEGKSEAPKKDITVSIYDRGAVSPDAGTIENNAWTKWINDNGPANVKFVAIPRTKPEEKINVLYASGSAPDLLFEFNPKARDPLQQQKQFMPLDDLIEKYSTDYKNLLKDNPLLKKAGMKDDGKLYYFGRINRGGPNRGLFIRTDWLKKLNLSMPKTTEELYTVLKAFTEQDPDGNGKRDTYGISLSGNSAYSLRQMFGGMSKWTVKDNQLVLNWDRSTEYYTLAKRLFDEGLIDKDFVNDTNGAKAKQDFINGKTGIYGFLNPDPITEKIGVIDPLKKNVSTAEIDFLPYPTSPFGAFMPTLSNPVQMTAAISATAKNPDAVIKYVDFLSKETTGKTLELGIEGTNYKVTEGCPEVLDAAKQKKEVTDLTVDMRMLQSAAPYTKCDAPLIKFKSDPRKEEYQKFQDDFFKTYLNFDRSYPELTISEHMPTPSKDLNIIETNTDKAIGDIWLKAIVSGEKYSISQALKDAQDAWSKAGGAQVEDWYKSWYETNKDNAFLAKDAIEISKKQYEDYKKMVGSLK